MTGNHQHPFTVGDFIVRRLSDWGVQRLFGYAGDGINGIIGGIQRAGNRPRFIATPHEEIAAFHPSPEVAERFYELQELEQSRPLSDDEREEIETYMYIEHFIRMLKAEAAIQAQKQAS